MGNHLSRLKNLLSIPLTVGIERLHEIREEVLRMRDSFVADARNRHIRRVREKRAARVDANRGELYKEFKAAAEAPLQIIKRPDGSITGDIGEMDSMLREAWGKFSTHTVPRIRPQQ